MSLKCTKCGSEGMFRVNGDASVWVNGDGEEVDHRESYDAYNGDYQAFCVSCGHDDSVQAFREYAEDRAKEDAAKVAASVKAAQLVPKEDYDDLKARFKKLEEDYRTLEAKNAVQADKLVQAASAHKDSLRFSVEDQNVIERLKREVKALTNQRDNLQYLVDNIREVTKGLHVQTRKED